MSDRPVRYCDVCKQYDDHPRHVSGNPLVGVAIRHMDCCAAGGCPECVATEELHGGLRGAALIEKLAADRAAREV